MENNIETHFTDKFGLVDPLLGKSDYRMGYESGFIKGAKWQKNDCVQFINKLEDESFDGWSKEAISGYLTASIR